MNDHGFTSAFATELDAYLAFKANMGFTGASRIWYLKQFDAYCAGYDRTVFDKDTVEGWVGVQLQRCGRYRSWMSYIRDFGRWMKMNGIPGAYVLSDRPGWAMTRRAADGLNAFTETVRGRITQAQVAGFDETGLRVEGRLHWVHCARTTSSPWSHATPNAVTRASTTTARSPGSQVSQYTTPGPLMTPIPARHTNCAARTHCASWPQSPTPRRRMVLGNSSRRRAGRDATPGR